MKFSHVRSYRNELIFQIDPKDLQYENGDFYPIYADIALFYPFMELSCGRVHKIEGEYSLLYNFATGLNDVNKGGALMDKTMQHLMSKKRYSCYQDFDKRMSA
jgi:hypothetical protein